jgi:tryptophan-rich sensory protein
MTTMRSSHLLGLCGWLLLVIVTAALGGLASANAGEFYAQLDRPSWAPPAWLFGPVWSVLYLMMGVAAWLIWKPAGFAGARLALLVFLLQLALNGLWSWLFFAWHLGLWSVVEIAVMWLLILVTIILFWRRHPLAGQLLIPYLAWVSFAGVLAYTLWQRNPALLG